MGTTLLLGALAVVASEGVRTRKPSVVYVVTDDEDQMLGGSFPKTTEATPLPKAEKLLVEKGMTFTNMFIHVPICNPSRSTTLTGRYFHNLKKVGAQTGAMHVNMSKVHNSTFARDLQDAGYATGLFGKYANAMPAYVPLGWDAWLANNGGAYMHPTFTNREADEVTFEDQYATAVVGNESVKWIRAQKERPYFAYVAPKAAHEPFNPAPWYVDSWSPEWPSEEPRPERCWNATSEERADHGSNIPSQPTITDKGAHVVTGVFRNRWRTLMSVDDLIEALAAEVDFAHTYFFFTSDHGFQLGEFNMLMDKRHVYDWNTRVHLVVRGPGIAPHSQSSRVVTNVDLAPTFLQLAGSFPRHDFDGRDHNYDGRDHDFDGRSLVPLLLSEPEAHSRAVFPTRGETWQTAFIEYYFVDQNVKCVDDCTDPLDDYPNADANCVDLTTTPNQGCWGGKGCDADCYATEDSRNNFIGLRLINDTSSLLYVKYQRGNQNDEDVDFQTPDFIELFDASADPWMRTNLYNSTSSSVLASLDSTLMAYFDCQGAHQCPD